MSRTSRTYPERCEFEMNPHQAHSPPVYQLPTEIISHIFKLYLEPYPFDIDDLEDVDVYASLELGAVCSTWRQIAWSTSQLWTLVPVYFSREPDRNSANCELIEAWMERAVTHPLNVVVRSGMGEIHPEDDAFMKQLSPIIHLINTSSHRWQTLDLDMVSTVLLENIKFSWASSHLQAWRWILSDSDSEFDWFDFDEPEDSDEDLPHLSRLRLRRETIFHKILDISWSNLTVFFSTSFSSQQCYHFLKNVPQLTSATFLDVEYDQSWAMLTDQPFTCSSLSYLRVHSHVSSTNHFLDNITFPALKHLRADFLAFTGFLLVAALFKQQASTLTSLAVKRHPVAYPDPNAGRHWEALKMPTVTRLMLSGFNLITKQKHGHTFLAHLGRSCEAVGCDLDYNDIDIHSPVLPNLQHLIIQDTPRVSFHWHDILVELKREFGNHFDNQIHSTLKSITLSLASEIDMTESCIEKDDIGGFIDVIRSGVPLRIINDFENPAKRVDLIKTSMEAYQFSIEDIEKYMQLAASIEVDGEDWRDWGLNDAIRFMTN